MRAEVFRFLQSPEGADLLASLAATPITPDSQLPIISRLRKTIVPELAQAAVETALLRQKAAAKFSRAAEMFFTRDGLEQATAEPLAIHRAHRFSDAGMASIADLGCGLGGDALALAGIADVIGFDHDPVRLSMARANVGVYGRASRFLPVAADLNTLLPLRVDAFFFDPARRTRSDAHSAPSRRLRSAEAYQPPLSLIDSWLPFVPAGAVKVAPGIDYDEIPATAEAEFVSYRGEVREGVLWFGDLRRGRRRATLLPVGVSITNNDDDGTDVEVGEPLAYVYEPDGAVIRAHLVTTVARMLDARLLSADIAYLTGDKLNESVFAKCYRLESWFPFQLKRLRSYLRERHVGRVVIKKRGSPLDPDDLRRALELSGSEERIVFLTQVLGKPSVLVAFPRLNTSHQSTEG